MAQPNPFVPNRLFPDQGDPFAAAAPTPADAYTANAQAYQAWLAQQRASGVASGMIDPQTGWPTRNALIDAARQYGGALIGGTTAPGKASMPAMDPIKHMLDHIAADPEATWGLRVLDEPIAGGPGTMLHPSRVWDDGTPTEDLLHGVSTVGINGADQKALEKALGHAGVAPYGKPHAYYYGEHVYLVKGEPESGTPGYDAGEQIIPDAQVVAAYRKADAGPSALLPVNPPQ